MPTPLSPSRQLFAIRGRQRFPVASVWEAAAKWEKFRDKALAGVSRLGNGVRVVDSAGAFVARVSYNGRVWMDEESRAA